MVKCLPMAWFSCYSKLDLESTQGPQLPQTQFQSHMKFTWSFCETSKVHEWLVKYVVVICLHRNFRLSHNTIFTRYIILCAQVIKSQVWSKDENYSWWIQWHLRLQCSALPDRVYFILSKQIVLQDVSVGKEVLMHVPLHLTQFALVRTPFRCRSGDGLHRCIGWQQSHLRFRWGS